MSVPLHVILHNWQFCASYNRSSRNVAIRVHAELPLNLLEMNVRNVPGVTANI